MIRDSLGMRSARLGALLVTTAASALMAAGAAQAQTARAGGPPQSNAIEEVVVTARRSEERLQGVPVAVSVVSPANIERKGSFEPQDLASLSTGLSVAATIGDRSNVTYSIRGQNKSFGTIFPAVITYFNEVPIANLAGGNFFDLDNVQVLRGPQGVLFGRVTDGGNVMLTPKHPTNRFEGYVTAKVGNYNLHSVEGAVNLPVVDDKVLVRAAFDIERRDGFTKNDFNGQDLDDVHSDAFRVGITLRPVDGFENYTVVNYQHIDNHGTATVLAGINPAALNATTGGVLALFGLPAFGIPTAYGLNAFGNVVPMQPGLTPLTPASYLASLQSQLAAQQARGARHVFLTTPSFDEQKSLYVVNTTSVDLTPDIQFKNIVGYTKFTDWEASNFTGDNSYLVATCHSACAQIAGSCSGIPFGSQEQLSEEMRLAGKSFDHKLTWSLGAYFDHQKPGEAFQNDTVNVGVLHRTGVQYTDTWSKAVFGYGEYDLSDFLRGLKFNAGYRYTEDKVKSSTVTYIAPIASPLAQSVMQTILGLNPQTAPIAGLIASQTANFAIPFGQCLTVQSFNIFSLSNPNRSFACQNFEAKFVAHTWQVGASYELPGGQLVYAKASRGYRPGGVNGSAPANVSPQYTPEFDTSVEAGIKADWHVADMPVRTNLAIFHDDYTNIQKQTVLPGPVPLQIVRNTAQATIRGIEFEGTIRPTRGLTLGVNYAYTDASFKRVNTLGTPTDPCNPTGTAVAGFCTSNWLSFTPRNQVNITVDYRLPLDASVGEVSVGALYHYQSRIALTDTSELNPAAIEPAYGTLDLNASWTNVYGRPFDLSFFMTNVTDKLYRTGTDDLTQRSSLGVRANIYAPPRMFGFAIKYRFGSAS